jgi:hypothetical protein
LGSGETTVITVKFSPFSIGSKNASLKIANDSENLSQIHSIELYGIGEADEFSGNYNNINSFEFWLYDKYN